MYLDPWSPSKQMLIRSVFSPIVITEPRYTLRGKAILEEILKTRNIENKIVLLSEKV